jgi:hypothetical protein
MNFIWSTKGAHKVIKLCYDVRWCVGSHSGGSDSFESVGDYGGSGGGCVSVNGPDDAGGSYSFVD